MLPSVGVGEAVRRYKLLTILPVIILVGLGLGYSLARTPTYSAESRQSIGRIDVNQPGALAAFQSATQGLASSYSRAIVANSVTSRVSRRTGLPVGVVRDRLSASPVPQSPIFVVRAKGTSEKQAIALAKEGAAALRAYVFNLNTRNPNGGRLLKEFKRASLELARRQSDLSALRKADGDSPTADQRSEISRAKARVSSASLRSDVAKQNYRTSQQSQANVSLLQNLTVPESATNDRFTRLQTILFVALAIGVLMGIALAVLRSNQIVRRVTSAV